MYPPQATALKGSSVLLLNPTASSAATASAVMDGDASVLLVAAVVVEAVALRAAAAMGMALGDTNSVLAGRWLCL